MQVHMISVDDIVVKSNRQRRNMDQSKILELAASISENGLINPVTLRKEDGEYVLVAGERRMKALEHLWFLGTEIHYGEYEIPESVVPCNFLGDIDPIMAEEIELEENIRREDLDWKERSDAMARLAALRAAQAQRDGRPTPSVADIAEETTGSREGSFQENVRQDIILGQALKDEKVAAVLAPAKSRAEAFKLLKRHEETQRNIALGQSVGATFSAAMHTLRQGDCIQIMQELPESSFDVILTDPPYGIGADEFADSGGKAAGSHFYDDSYETWSLLAKHLAVGSFRLAKAEGHCYVFCDIERFIELRSYFIAAGWKTFRTPLIWINPSAVRAPWPEHGPQRKYQCILFAIKGNRPVTRIYGDVLTYSSDSNLGHPAQKPVALYSDLLRRSVRPGDSVLDPFAGTGTIFPAAHEHKCRATAIERDTAACGIASKRLGELK